MRLALAWRSFELRAVEAIAAGQEALITYGEDKPNSMLLRDYGARVGSCA